MTHVPLDEEVKKRYDKLIYDCQVRATFQTQIYDPAWDRVIQAFIAQELANLRHTIRSEIEELRKKTVTTPIPVPNGMCHVCNKALVNRNKNSSYCRECLTTLQKQRVSGSTRRSGYNQAVDDALSVKSLKESE